MCEHTLSKKGVWPMHLCLVVRFCHARITYRNVDRLPHRTMGISHCGKVYSSISASIPTCSLSLSHFFALSLSDHFFLLERVGVMDVFFQESLFEWQWFSSEVVISLNMSHATSRDPFQQIKMCRKKPPGLKVHPLFFFSDADYRLYLWRVEYDVLKGVY